VSVYLACERNPRGLCGVSSTTSSLRRFVMGFGRGMLLWLLGIPLPIIILLAIFWHH
jgi:hypothetical protein